MDNSFRYLKSLQYKRRSSNLEFFDVIILIILAKPVTLGSSKI